MRIRQLLALLLVAMCVVAFRADDYPWSTNTQRW